MKYVQKKGRDNEKKGTCHYSTVTLVISESINEHKLHM